MDTKVCSCCKRTLDLTHFSKSGRSASTYRGKPKVQRYSSRCKSCAAAYAKEWRARNPTYHKPNTKLSHADKYFASFIRVKLSDAKGRSHSAVLSFEEAVMLWNSQQGLCAISGIPLSLTKGSLDVASLDQIIPGKGYLIDNVQWVSWRVNRAKGEQSLEELLEMCRAILKV